MQRSESIVIIYIAHHDTTLRPECPINPVEKGSLLLVKPGDKANNPTLPTPSTEYIPRCPTHHLVVLEPLRIEARELPVNHPQTTVGGYNEVLRVKIEMC